MSLNAAYRTNSAADTITRQAKYANRLGLDDTCAPIFIVGCGRSGTTLLRLILNRHRDLAMFGESGIFFRADKYDTLGHARSFARFIRDWRAICHVESPYPDLVDDDRLQHELQLAPSYTAATSVIMKRFAKLEGKPVWGEKTPAHVHRIPSILHAYPRARIIHITRDPRAVTNSALTNFPGGRFNLKSVYNEAAYWTKCESAIERFSVLAAPQILKIRYEDLVGSPERIVQHVCAFLRIDFDETMLNTACSAKRYGPKTEDGTIIAHHLGLMRNVNQERIEAWKETLTIEMIGLIQYVAKDWMLRRGYSLDERAASLVPSITRRLLFRTQHSLDRASQLAQREILHVYWRMRILAEL